MQLLRKILCYIFAAIYVVLCPLLILYAFGYIYKPGEKTSIVETGLIYLSTAPSGAAIYIDNSRYDQSTPAVIRNLLPGNYAIRLVLEDYEPWGQTVPVEAEKATVMDKVLLLPKEWESRVLLPGPYEDLISMPGTNFFLTKSGPAIKDITICNYKEGEAGPLSREGSLLGQMKILSYFTVEKSPAILFYCDSPQGKKYLWTRLDKEKDPVRDVTELFSGIPEQIEWLAYQEMNLFAFQEGYLNQIDLVSEAVYPEYIKKVRGYGLFDSQIYVLKDDNVFMRMDYNKGNRKILLDDTDITESIFGKEGFFRVDVLSENFILFLGEKGQLLSNRLPYRFVEEGVRGIEFFPKLERVLIWKKDRIGVLDFSTEETGDLAFEKPPKLAWIFTQGKNIEQAFWAYEDSHVLFRDGSDIFLIEIESYGKFKLDHIFKVKKNSSVFYSQETQEMYFLDSATGELFAVGIVPSKGVIQLPFPEIEKEKKKSKIEELWTSTSPAAD